MRERSNLWLQLSLTAHFMFFPRWNHQNCCKSKEKKLSEGEKVNLELYHRDQKRFQNPCVIKNYLKKSNFLTIQILLSEEKLFSSTDTWNSDCKGRLNVLEIHLWDPT